jgi:hypothetical protein
VSTRLAHLMLRLYPLAYRRRYGEEMEALLEDGASGPAAVVDLLRGAIGAHLRPAPGVSAEVPREERLRRGLGAVLLCWLVFAVAGLALYKTIEGRPFEGVQGTPAALGTLHLAIQLLAVLGGAAVLVGAAPFALAALRDRRRDAVAAPRDGVKGAGARCGSPTSEPSRRAFILAGACAAVAAAAMVGIAMLTAAYLVALTTSAPALAGEPNGPFGTPDVAVSLALQLTLMVAVAAPAALVAFRTRRALAR